jgi:5-methylcytosine-specific restriction endonuclease McrA
MSRKVTIEDLPFSKRRLTVRVKTPSVKQLDELAREMIRARDKGKCRRCGRTANLQVAHVYSRARRSTRWEPLNLFLLCPNCHMNFSAWVKIQLGVKGFNLLQWRANDTSKTDRSLVKLFLEQEITNAKRI